MSCPELPFDRYKRLFSYLVASRRVVILAGETGSGKSTRIPQFLYEFGLDNICITQPKRVAAIQLAKRVAANIGCELGSTVGYAIRFQDVTHPDTTKIKFVTEGLLLRELLADPLLKQYSFIVVDEVHERNTNTDLLLGLLKCILLKRSDLKLILCSATIDIESVFSFFKFEAESVKVEPAVLQVEGKTHPTKIYHIEKPVANYLDACVETAISIHENVRLGSGSILIFLTGLDEISYVCDKLIDYARIVLNRLDLRKLSILPFHGSLDTTEISRIFDVPSRTTRNCIVSTNIAETSLTIPEIAYVIDCGYSKTRIFDASSGIDTLLRGKISKSCAKQRAGRAGRTREGLVYRLYSEAEFEKLEDNSTPELLRSCLAEPVMLLLSLGVENVSEFPLISPLPIVNLISAFELLFTLGAIDEAGQLTGLGELMARMNLDPKLSKTIVDPRSASCTAELCIILASIQVNNVFTKSRKYSNSLWSNEDLIKLCSADGDLLTYLNIINSFRANGSNQKWADRRNLDFKALTEICELSGKIESQLIRLGLRVQSCKGRAEPLKQALAAGLFANSAYLHPSGQYRTIRGEIPVDMHPHSVYSQALDRPKHVIFVEVLSTTKNYMRHVMGISSDGLVAAAPHFYKMSTGITS